MRKINLITPMVILTICAVAETAIGYAYSVDARGFWPMLLAFTLLIYACYSALFSLIAGDRTLSAAYILRFNGALAAVRVITSYLFYVLIVDWGPINEGTTQLTPFESLVYSKWTPYLTPVFFLVVHLVTVSLGWLGGNRLTDNSD
jgi:hypothetical protein